MYNLVNYKNLAQSLSAMPYRWASGAGCYVTIGTKVYVAGGIIGAKWGSITDKFVMYDSESDTWTELTPMNTPRFAPGCTHNEGKIYVFGGQTDDFGPHLNSTEVYDVESQTWTESTAQLTEQSHWISAAYVNVAGRNLSVIMGGIKYVNSTFKYIRDNLDVYDMDLDEIVFRGKMDSPRYAFESITLSHDDWDSKWILVCTCCI